VAAGCCQIARSGAVEAYVTASCEAGSDTDHSGLEVLGAVADGMEHAMDILKSKKRGGGAAAAAAVLRKLCNDHARFDLDAPQSRVVEVREASQ